MSIVIVGAGPNLGLAVGRRFGREGFAVGLVSRTQAKLDDLAAQLESESITAAAAAPTRQLGQGDPPQHVVKASDGLIVARVSDAKLLNPPSRGSVEARERPGARAIAGRAWFDGQSTPTRACRRGRRHGEMVPPKSRLVCRASVDFHGQARWNPSVPASVNAIAPLPAASSWRALTRRSP